MRQLIRINDENTDLFVAYLPEKLVKYTVNDRKAVVYGIASGDTACGAVLVREDFPEAELIWICLHPDYRGYGIASEILADMILEYRRAGMIRITASLSPDEGRIGDLLRGLSFVTGEADTGVICVLAGELSENHTLMTPMADRHISELAGVSEMMLRMLGNHLAENRIEIVDLPILPEDYDTECSCVYREDEEITGILLIKEHLNDTGDGRSESFLRVEFLYSFSADRLAYMSMIRSAAQKVCLKYPEDTRIEMCVVNDHLGEFLEKLFNKKAELSTRAVLELDILNDIN